MHLRLLIPLLALLSMLPPLPALAKHGAPPRVEPVIREGIRYVVPNDQGRRAYVEAWDDRDGNKLWTKTVFKRWYCPLLGTECMRYEYIASMTLQADQLRLTSERGREFTLGDRTRAVRLVSPLAGRFAGPARSGMAQRTQGSLSRW